jgi:isopenicillin N synthase-like dioxygenase
MNVVTVSFSDILYGGKETVDAVERAFREDGIVAVSEIPDLHVTVRKFVDECIAFESRSLEDRLLCAPTEKSGMYGYEIGAERFKDESGNWVPDDRKVSYYAHLHDRDNNRWPADDAGALFKQTYMFLADTMHQIGASVLDLTGTFDAAKGLELKQVTGVGRMLHYLGTEKDDGNPNWCGVHSDHGLFTALLPEVFLDAAGNRIPPPPGAGLHVKPHSGSEFLRVEVKNPENTLLFQVGEFAQLLTDDRLTATKHCVRKAYGGVQRYTLAVFFDVAETFGFSSTSVLATDERWKGNAGDSGTVNWKTWHEASLARYKNV